MSSVLIKNGTIVTASNEYQADVYIENGVIAKIGTDLNDAAEKVIDAEGKYIMPGGVDQHLHFDLKFGDMQVVGWDTTKAALAGGTTTVVAFAAQKVGKGIKESMESYMKSDVDGKVCCDYSLHPVIQDKAFLDDIASLPEIGISTCKMFMAYKNHPQHSDDDTILKALKIANDAGVLVMLHCENQDMIDAMQKEVLGKGITEPYGHILSRPPVVETEATERAVHFAELTDAPVYVAHVTTAGAVDAIREGYAEGKKIYGETCTHYLLLTNEVVKAPDFEGAKYVCSPALRDKEDNEVLWDAVKKGYLNAISSDHCGFNFAVHKKQGIDDFRNIPNGTPGMENRLPMVWTEGVAKGKISRQKFVELCCTNPAKINGLFPQKGNIGIGADADIVIYNPVGTSVVSVKNSLQGLDYNAYEGREQSGKPETVLLRGKVVVENGKYVGTEGEGRFVTAKPFGMCYE